MKKTLTKDGRTRKTDNQDLIAALVGAGWKFKEGISLKKKSKKTESAK